MLGCKSWVEAITPVSFAHRSRDLGYLCPPPSARLLWYIHPAQRCRAQGHSSSSHTNTPLSRHQNLINPVWDFWWNPTKLWWELELCSLFQGWLLQHSHPLFWSPQLCGSADTRSATALLLPLRSAGGLLQWPQRWAWPPPPQAGPPGRHSPAS